MSVIISPSLLSADFSMLAAEAETLERSGVGWLHLDVMDGSFVPNITFGAPVISSLRKRTGLFFDAHLMIDNPGRYIRDFARAGADLITFHIEAAPHPQRCLGEIRELGLKAGIALDPDTGLERLRWLLPYLDLALIMGVNPGFSGQKYIPGTADKVRECREFLKFHGFGAMPVEIDGGVNLENAGTLVSAGANILVSGSAFFNYGNYGEALRAFESRASNANSGETPEDPAYAAARSWRRQG